MEKRIMLVHSIFESISGEAGFFPQGTWCTFIRLQHCNLRCHWCDTPEAQARESDVAKEMSFEKIADQCLTKHILITGGEPLFRNQNELIELIMLLINKKHFIQIETNGSINLPGPYVPPKDKVFWVMDRKTLSSGMTGKMIPVDQLKEQCEVNSVIFKYVISHELDLNWAISDMKRFPEQEKFIISPVDADGSKILWMKDKILRVSEELIDKIIFSIQMHKILNLS
jgi:7-carboxy-7-deazaguanine synthase